MSQGSSIGVALCHTSAELKAALEAARAGDFPYLLEPYCAGTEYAVTVTGSGNASTAFLPVEVQYAGEFFSAACKESGGYRMSEARSLSGAQCTLLQDYAKQAHRLLRATAATRTDFIVGADGGVHILEVNACPGLSAHSILPAQLALSGTRFADYLESLIGACI